MSRNVIQAIGLAAVLTAAGACSSSSGGGSADGGLADGAARDGRVKPDKGTCPSPDAGAPRSCGTSLEVLKGKQQVVLRTLKVAGQNKGFDLNNADCDGKDETGADNALFAVGVIAEKQLSESMGQGEIVIPFEFFGLDDIQKDDCVDFALYVGKFPPDADGDGQKAGGSLGKPGKDCNDHDKAIRPGVKEVPGNRVDDDCDGLADEAGSKPSTDTGDQDGDGQSIAAGDCDDRKGLGATVKKGGTEVCGDGLDNDCDGKADEGCLPWSAGMATPVDPASLTKDGKRGAVIFRGARITGGRLRGGPARFSLAIAIKRGTNFNLDLSDVFIEADVRRQGKGIALDKGMLGGVLSARVLDSAPNLIASLVGGDKSSTMLDVMVGPLGSSVLSLPKDDAGNAFPDVDVDGDGIEKFLDTNPSDGVFKVDTCVDGDGTRIKDTKDAKGKVISCTAALDKNGKPRFVDGWSVALEFTGVPARLSRVSGSR